MVIISYHFEHLLNFIHCHKLFSFILSLKPHKNSLSWIVITSTMQMNKKRLNNYPKITASKWWSQRFIPTAHVLSRRQVCSCEQSTLVRAVFGQRNSIPPISWGEVGDVEENYWDVSHDCGKDRDAMPGVHWNQDFKATRFSLVSFLLVPMLLL